MTTLKEIEKAAQHTKANSVSLSNMVSPLPCPFCGEEPFVFGNKELQCRTSLCAIENIMIEPMKWKQRHAPVRAVIFHGVSSFCESSCL